MATHNLGRTSFGDPKNAGNLMTIEEAHQLLNDWVPNERLRKWELAGLLHDADWEKYPDDHCRIIIEEMERRNIDPEVIRCIASHGPGYFGVQPESKMEKMIYAFDELSGFVHASALIRPTKYEGMDVKSVMKKLKTLSFAAQVSRDDINDALSRIDTSLEELIQYIIEHQKNIS